MKYLVTYFFLLMSLFSFSQDWINGRYYSGGGGQSLWMKLTEVEFYYSNSGLSELNSQSEDFVVLEVISKNSMNVNLMRNGEVFLNEVVYFKVKSGKVILEDSKIRKGKYPFTYSVTKKKSIFIRGNNDNEIIHFYGTKSISYLLCTPFVGVGGFDKCKLKKK